MRYSRRISSKTKSKPSIINILVDDRERNPWKIDHPDFRFETQRLKVGDYTIKGFEDTIAIEKKSGIIELISNLSGRDRPRFKKFLEKLSAYPIKCIIIEDSLSHIDAAFRSCTKTHLTQASIYHWISVINIRYNIPTIFIGNNKKYHSEFLYYLFSEALMQAKILDNN